MSDITEAPPMNNSEKSSKMKKEEVSLATFAGGCFWCMEPPFDEIDGVLSTVVGYAGGQLLNPTYKQVSKGGTGHAEVIQIRFDPSRVSYEALLDVFWKNIDPTAKDRQFCDSGDQYRSAIFVQTKSQKLAATASLSELKASKRFPEIYTQIETMETFYPAEEYHQDYYKKNPVRYKFYRYGCGRDKVLKSLWGK